MEPISAIAISLALGAGATAGKEMVSAVVKDAYGKLKELVQRRYPKISIELIEQAPESKCLSGFFLFNINDLHHGGSQHLKSQRIKPSNFNGCAALEYR